MAGHTNSEVSLCLLLRQMDVTVDPTAGRWERDGQACQSGPSLSRLTFAAVPDLPPPPWLKAGSGRGGQSVNGVHPRLCSTRHRAWHEVGPPINNTAEKLGRPLPCSIPDLTQWFKDLAWLWLWHRPADAALIGPLAWEFPYAMDAAIKRKKRKKERKKNSDSI